jgi:hypothetical protein
LAVSTAKKHVRSDLNSATMIARRSKLISLASTSFEVLKEGAFLSLPSPNVFIVEAAKLSIQRTVPISKVTIPWYCNC